MKGHTTTRDNQAFRRRERSLIRILRTCEKQPLSEQEKTRVLAAAYAARCYFSGVTREAAKRLAIQAIDLGRDEETPPQ